MPALVRVLVFEDSPTDALLLQEALSEDRFTTFEVTLVERLAQGLALLSHTGFDAVVLDLKLPDSVGLVTFKTVYQQAPHLPTLILSGLADEQIAIETVQAGAQDYLLKGPSGWAQAARAIRYALERHQTHVALETAERHFRALIESNDDAILKVSATGQLLYASTASERITGYTLAEWQTCPPFELIHLDDQPTVRTVFQNLLADSATALTVEFRQRHKNGQWVWVEAIGRNLLADPVVQAIVVNYRDISKRKRVELALRASEARFATLFHTNPARVALTRFKDGLFLAVNEAFLDSSGYTREEVVGHTSAELDDWDDSPARARFREQLQTAGVVQNFEARLHHRQGGVREVIISAELLELEGETCVLTVTMDITERKQAEEKLRQSEARAQAMLNAIPDLIFRIDRQGIFLDYRADLRDLYANPAGSLIGQRNRNLVPAEFADLVDAKIQATLATGTLQTFEYQLPTPTRGLRDYEARMVPSGADEVLAIVRDITERKQAEMQIQLAQHLAQATIDSLAAHICVLDDAGVIISVNRAWRDFADANPPAPRHYGLGANYLTVCDNAALQGDHDAQVVAEGLRRMLTGDLAEFTLEYPCPAPNILRWFIVRIRPFDATTSRRFSVAHESITERRLAEEAVRESEEKFRTFIEQSSEGVTLTDERGLIIEWNSAQETLTGLTRAQVMGRPLWEIEFQLLPLDQQSSPTLAQLKRRLNTVLQTGFSPVSHKAMEIEMVTPLGEVKIIQQVAFLITMPDGFRLAGTSRDITASKRAEAERLRLLQALGKRIQELTALHQAARLFQNMTLTEGEVLQALVALLPPAMQFRERAAARLTFAGQDYATPGFVSTPWLLTTTFTLADGRTGHLEVAYLANEAFTTDSPFLVEERALLDSLTENLQTHLTRRQNEAEVQHRTTELAQLLDIARALSETLDETVIYATLYRYLSAVVPCERLVVVAYHPEHATLTCEYWQTPAGAQSVAQLSAREFNASGDSLAKRVVQAGLALFLSGDTLQTEWEDAMPPEPRRMSSAIGVPLRMGGRVTGVLQVFSVSPNAYTADQVRLVEALAFRVSTALYNARLFAELDRRVRERTAELQDLYNNAPAGYHSLDANGCYIRVNDTELRWLGYTREEILGRPIIELFSPTTRDTFQKSYPLFIQQGWINDAKFDMLRKDGSTFSVSVNATALYDEAGQFVMSRSTVTDVTERQRAEDAIRASEAQLQDFLDNANDLIQSLTPSGQFQYVNRAWCTRLGYTASEAQALHFREVIHPMALAAYEQTLAELLATGEAQFLEVSLRTRDGEQVLMEGYVNAYQAEGQGTAVRGIFRDVTLRKQAEATLLNANHELEQALRLKDEFLANMSHELRTPLHGILAMSESLLEQIRGPLNERQQKSVRAIESSGRHLLTLINDLLDLSKIGAGKLELYLEALLADELCQASLSFVRELAGKKSIHLAYDDPPAPHVQVWADPKRLKHMLVNLLSNAVKFTPAGGQVRLSVKAEEHQVHFAVRDTGPGIAPEDWPKLFQPFTQLDSTLARQHEGTGLGLVLVQRLATHQGGTVQVESAGVPGLGACFTISLPRAVERSDRARASSPAPGVSSVSASPSKTRVLLIEDNEVNMLVVSEYLEVKGYQLSLARTGPEGLARAETELPDLILMDIQLPLMDGLAVTRHLRQDPRFSATPIIALTALAMPGDRERCLQAGATAYFSKPLILKELVELMERLLHPPEAT